MVWRSSVSARTNSGAKPQWESNLVHFSLKIWHTNDITVLSKDVASAIVSSLLQLMQYRLTNFSVFCNKVKCVHRRSRFQREGGPWDPMSRRWTRPICWSCRQFSALDSSRRRSALPWLSTASCGDLPESLRCRSQGRGTCARPRRPARNIDDHSMDLKTLGLKANSHL